MSMLDWRYYPKIARIARMAGATSDAVPKR